MKLLAIAVLLGHLATRPLVAQTDPNPILNGAVSAFSRVQTLRADFTQVIHDEMIGADATSRGEYLQQRPNKLAMRFREPAGDVIVADGAWLWVYLPSSAPGQVVKSSINSTPGQTPDIVAEFLERPRERFNVSFVRSEAVANRPADALAFVPKQPGGAYRKVTMWIDRGDSLPHQIEIIEASGTVRRFVFEHIRVNTPIPAGTFTFRPPAGARVVDASNE